MLGPFTGGIDSGCTDGFYRIVHGIDRGKARITTVRIELGGNIGKLGRHCHQGFRARAAGQECG